jgi:hypothetical protein
MTSYPQSIPLPITDMSNINFVRIIDSECPACKSPYTRANNYQNVTFCTVCRFTKTLVRTETKKQRDLYGKCIIFRDGDECPSCELARVRPNHAKWCNYPAKHLIGKTPNGVLRHREAITASKYTDVTESVLAGLQCDTCATNWNYSV